jgi:hypothetical protein
MKLVLLALLSLVSFPVMAATGVSVDSLISTLIYVIVIGLVFWLLWWLIAYVGLPEPFNKLARVILAIAAVLVILNLLLGFAGHPIINFR